MNSRLIVKNHMLEIVLIIALLFFLGNLTTPILSAIALIVLLFTVLLNDRVENYYILYFFIPNIRIADSLGNSFFINLVFFLIGILLLIEKRVIIKEGMYFTCLIAVLSLIHLFENTYSFSTIIPFINLVFNVLVFCLLLSNKTIELKTELAVQYLSLGIIYSLISYLFINPSMLEQLFVSNYRLAGFGDDPNYLSIYILISISFSLLFCRSSNKVFLLSLNIVLLFVLGLLTSSKMFILCLFLIVFAFLASTIIYINKKASNALVIILCIIAVVVLFLFDKVVILINKVVGRFGESIFDSSSFSLDTFSTGRIDIINHYLSEANSNLFSILFGRGINYNLFYSSYLGDYRAVHNTYLDVYLSWGIVGTVLFIIFLSLLLKKTCNFKKATDFYDYVPLVILLLSLFSLSCLTADMFWYVLLLVLNPFKNRISINKGDQTVV